MIKNTVMYKEENKANVNPSIKFYETEARRIIKKFGGSGRNLMLCSDEFFSQIMNKLMLADWRWSENRGMSKSSYRVQCGRWAIGEIYRSLYTKRGMAFEEAVENSSLLEAIEGAENTNIENEEYVNFLLKNVSGLQEQCIRMYYLKGMKLKEIAEELSCSPQWVNMSIRRGLKKLKKVAEMDL